MYVCLCNALTDTQVRDAACQGAGRPSEVQAACGCRAQCGNCAKVIQALLRDLPPAALAGYAERMGRAA